MATNSKAASAISSIPDSRKLLDAVNSMDTRSLEVFTQQVIQLLAHRKSARNLSETEALLLKEIYTIIPEKEYMKIPILKPTLYHSIVMLR